MRVFTGSHSLYTMKTLSLKLIAVAVSAVLALTPALAFATPASVAQAEAEVALAKLNDLQAQLDEASNVYFSALAEQEDAQGKVDAAQARIDEATQQISTLQAQLGTRAKSMYRSGAISFLDILLGSSSFKDFATNWDLLEQMNQKDAALTKETKVLRQEVREQKKVYAEQVEIAAQKAAEAKEVQDAAAVLVADMQATYDSLSAEAAELLAQEQAAQSARDAAAAQQAIAAGGGGGYEPPYNAATGNAVVDRALSYVGNAQYVWGACSPGAFDCSGFVSYCLTGQYARLGTTYTFLGWQQVWDPQPGDVCVNSGHCGIYYGGGQMIHCASPGQGVIISGVQSGMIYVRY